MDSNFLTNPLEPLFSFSPEEIALMTQQEFLDYRNPGNRYHEEDAYNFDLSDLNKNYQLHEVASIRTPEGSFYIFKSDNDYLIEFERLHERTSQLAAIVHNEILYYSDPWFRRRLPTGYQALHSDWTNFNFEEKKRVKYLEELLPLVNRIPERNLKRYPYLYQQILVGGHPYQIRFSEFPTLNKGQTIAIFNDLGWVVAQASNEWGASLVVVAEEYRRRGLGKILGQVWYTWNPEYLSGGFTSLGRINAIAIWEQRVREFLAKGWYSELIRQKRLTSTRLRTILADLSKSKPPVIPQKEEDKRVLIFVEKEQNYWGPTFIIYDEAFYQEEDEKYIYAFGFFRDASVGSFLFTIDYERAFDKLATYLALQIARNNQEKVYIGEGYGDMLELENLSHLQIDGDYVTLTQDVLDLNRIRSQEYYVRRRYDNTYHEKRDRLIEMAHAKWL